MPDSWLDTGIDPWLAGLGLLLLMITSLALLLPLRARSSILVPRHAGALGIFKDQLAEIDRDAARGLIGSEEAESARIEIQRRMIVADKTAATQVGAVAAAGRTRTTLYLLVTVALAAPIAGAALYWTISDPFARSGELAREAAERQDVAKLATQLQDRLGADPDSPTEGWLLLARTYVGLGEMASAIAAYETVLDRSDMPADGLARYAELLLRTSEGVTPAAATAALDRALAMTPEGRAADPRAVYFRALAYDQAGDRDGALSLLAKQLTAFDGAEPIMLVRLRDALRQADTGPTMPVPDGAAVAAAEALSADDRNAFIRSMVDGLAQRLEAEPDDLDGWLRLARAYRVLGETDAARRALKTAEPLLADLASDDPRRSMVADELSALR